MTSRRFVIFRYPLVAIVYRGYKKIITWYRSYAVKKVIQNPSSRRPAVAKYKKTYSARDIVMHMFLDRINKRATKKGGP